LNALDLNGCFPELQSLPRDEALLLRAPPVGSIDLLVVHPDGSPAAGWQIFAATWIGEGPAPEEEAKLYEQSDGRRGETGPDGRATLEGVRAGMVLVRADRLCQGWGGGLEEPRASARLALGRGERAQLRLTLHDP
jgi:hypothetical protein